MNRQIFRRILMPGLILQSVMIGGGYATGREIVEFFLVLGPSGGLLAMGVATVVISVITAISFELARKTKSHTYHAFFGQLLGRGQVLYELGYFLMGLLVISVIASAAGEIAQKHLGLSSSFGTLGLAILIGVLAIYGTHLIEQVLTGWSLLLYATYFAFVILYVSDFGDDLLSNLSQPVDGEWFYNGIKYVGFNLSVIPLILFCVVHLQSRSDALMAGALAGPLAMLPAVLLYLPMIVSYPEILGAAVPSDFMIDRLDMRWMSLIFYLVLFGTFVETGTAYIHALNERIAEAQRSNGRKMAFWQRGVTVLVVLIAANVLANEFGLIQLIADGYGTLTWFFILVFAIPLLTRGSWLIFSNRENDHA